MNSEIELEHAKAGKGSKKTVDGESVQQAADVHQPPTQVGQADLSESGGRGL